MEQRVILGLGSSLGDRGFYLRLAILSLHHHPHIQVEKRSSIWGSLPLGEAAKNIFWNMAIEIKTSLSPEQLLHTIIRIEERFGRKRAIRWSDRTIDIDILLYEQQIMQTEHLSIPHPEILNRGFVINPLLEIGADWIHPTEGCSLQEISFPIFLGLWKFGFLSLPIS